MASTDARCTVSGAASDNPFRGKDTHKQLLRNERGVGAGGHDRCDGFGAGDGRIGRFAQFEAAGLIAALRLRVFVLQGIHPGSFAACLIQAFICFSSNSPSRMSIQRGSPLFSVPPGGIGFNERPRKKVTLT